MFCRFCGQEIADDSLFCEFCGKKQEKSEVQVSQREYAEPVYEEPVYREPKKKGGKFAKIALFVVLGILLVFAAVKVVPRFLGKNKNLEEKLTERAWLVEVDPGYDYGVFEFYPNGQGRFRDMSIYEDYTQLPGLSSPEWEEWDSWDFIYEVEKNDYVDVFPLIEEWGTPVEDTSFRMSFTEKDGCFNTVTLDAFSPDGNMTVTFNIYPDPDSI